MAGIFVKSSKWNLNTLTGNVKLVIAIDIGTTSSVYAYSMSSDLCGVHLNKLWDSGDRGLCSSKTPTCILLSKTFEPIYIGYDAQNEYKLLIDENEEDDYIFVDKFKMELYDAKNISDEMKIDDIKGHPVPAIQVFSSMFSLLKKRIESEIKNIDSRLINNNVQWVLTIPAAWTDRAEFFIRTCAEKAEIHNDNLMIVIESESASVYMHHVFKELPNKYLLIDLGGGTDDITAHRVSKKGKLHEICKPSGNCHGGKHVDKQLFSCLEEIVGKQVIQNLKTKGNFLELLNEFENINYSISTSNAKHIACKFPLPLLNELCRKYRGKEFQEVLNYSKYKTSLFLKNGKLRIHREFIIGFISNVAALVVKDIQFVLKKAKPHDIDTFIVVGGFSNSNVIRDTFENAFPTVSIIYPVSDGDLAVVKGAVLYGQNPNYIKPCKKTANLK
ncbi:heat shock 70 kDa protein 12A-like [Mytilus californianus]|uniref:heat shock 70 kDa protein 12A-like n=1 Tax=Mytilus californianus TaxID=6549 RepID=UPI002247D3D8|nr:heat shock 70 kDa protein 12A-like [Mytilus californianus]